MTPEMSVVLDPTATCKAIADHITSLVAAGPGLYAKLHGDRPIVRASEGSEQPTELGRAVTRILSENFADIINISFTAKMEEDLDDLWHKNINSKYGLQFEHLQRCQIGEAIPLVRSNTGNQWKISFLMRSILKSQLMARRCEYRTVAHIVLYWLHSTRISV